MNKRFLNLIFIVFLCLVFINCANRGTPSGGPKDIDPPVILGSYPENYSTNFNGSEIEIEFDEYVKIKDLQKQLIISPPMKTQPEVRPMSGASKTISIKIFDTLQPNTTYAFNFGNSIVDNNESNPYPYYRYVFSTGDYIDSLSVNGYVVDAEKKEPDTFVSVALYEVDSTYTDSIVYKEFPKYITNTLDSVTTFSIENLKAGKYMLMALKDNNSDNKFQQKTDKIGFIKHFIDVPNDSIYELKLFKEDLDFDATRPRLTSGEKIIFGYEGDYKDMKIDITSETPDDFEYRITKDDRTDTLYYWYKPRLKVDSLLFKVTHPTLEKDFTVRISEQPRDSLTLNTSPTGTIKYKEPFKISGSTPFETFDASKISIMDKDSLNVEYTTSFDSITNTYDFNFDKTEDNRYSIEVLPEAFVGFFGTTHDTLSYNIRTQKLSDFGNLRLRLINATYPVIVQLTTQTANVDVKYEQYVTENRDIDFLNISPGKYSVRIIFDTNGNGKYDTGSFLKKIQPERISHFDLSEEVRADWNYQETFTLLKQ